jgi:hypothetical protein
VSHPPEDQELAELPPSLAKMRGVAEALDRVAVALAPLPDDAARLRVVRAAAMLLGFEIEP